MDHKEETIDQAKVATAFTKLQTNPEMIGSVKDAFANLFTKIGMDLNPQEELALARQIFAGDSGVVRAGESDPVYFGKDSCGSHPVPFISYQCKSCETPPPAIPLNTSNNCINCQPIPPVVAHSDSQCTYHSN
jgi:hypothetical protein